MHQVTTAANFHFIRNLEECTSSKVALIGIEGLYGRGTQALLNRENADQDLDNFIGAPGRKFVDKQQAIFSKIKGREDQILGLEVDQITTIRMGLYPIADQLLQYATNELACGRGLDRETVGYLYKFCNRLKVPNASPSDFAKCSRGKVTEYLEWKPTPQRKAQLERISHEMKIMWEREGIDKRNIGIAQTLITVSSILEGPSICLSVIGCGHLINGVRKQDTGIEVISLQKRLQTLGELPFILAAPAHCLRYLNPVEREQPTLPDLRSVE